MNAGIDALEQALLAGLAGADIDSPGRIIEQDEIRSGLQPLPDDGLLPIASGAAPCRAASLTKSPSSR